MERKRYKYCVHPGYQLLAEKRYDDQLGCSVKTGNTIRRYFSAQDIAKLYGIPEGEWVKYDHRKHHGTWIADLPHLFPDPKEKWRLPE